MSISSSHSKEMVMLWETFKYELIYENRFFLANPIINIIESIVKRTRIELIDQCLFRAREYLEDEYDYGYNYEKPRKILFESSEHINNGEIDKVDERYLYELFILGVVNGKDAKTLADKYSMGNSKFADMISKRIKSKEWGFGERESGRPPYSKAGINRANTKYIPFMYLADTLETALLEIDATTWKKYSVAKYRISDILYLADFSVEKFKLIAAELSDDEKTICDYVREAFSYPASSVDRDYIVSQYAKIFDKYPVYR